jgi:hypothetical protein
MGYIHFFDDWQLISHTNMKRCFGTPLYIPQATLEDGLTEGTWNFPCVAYDSKKDKYIALYGGAATLPLHHKLKIPKGVDQKLKPRTQVLCYAECSDGINWDKPDLSSKANFEGPVFAKNQVFGLKQGLDGAPVTYDPFDKNQEKRFKYLINFRRDNHKNIRALVTSPDGISWKISQYFEKQTGTDTPTSVFYNPKKNLYTFNVRKYAGDRRIFFFNTKDWRNFTEPELVMHPDSLDPPLVGFYGMPVFYYENLFIGLLWKIYCDPTTNSLANGPIDCELVYSYDGNHFNRTNHKPFIKRNPLGEHGGGCIYTGAMLVDPENTIRFYSGGSKAEHFQNQELIDAALMLHTLRLDGFVYISTVAGKGSIRTRPLYINGNDLRINARSPFGEVRVQIIDENGYVLPGFSFSECHPLTGDELFWTPAWKDGKTFGDAKSHKRRQIELAVTTGELYAIRGDFEIMTSLWLDDSQRINN